MEVPGENNELEFPKVDPDPKVEPAPVPNILLSVLGFDVVPNGEGGVG